MKQAQMEMEQQLSTLITMVQTVQEQQAGQQELSRTLKSGLEGLALSQHEQGACLEARMEELLQRSRMLVALNWNSDRQREVHTAMGESPV